MESNSDGLSGKQATAVGLMMRGMTDGEVAKRTRVSRKTINVWRNHDAEFQMEMAKQRQALHARNQDAMHALVGMAIEVMKDILGGENARLKLSAARAVLRISGLEAAMRSEQPATREAVMQEFLSEVIGRAAQKMGVGEVKRLGGGE